MAYGAGAGPSHPTGSQPRVRLFSFPPFLFVFGLMDGQYCFMKRKSRTEGAGAVGVLGPTREALFSAVGFKTSRAVRGGVPQHIAGWQEPVLRRCFRLSFGIFLLFFSRV
ncbi:hypothetical protein M427DRAFT_354931 [Gonapodya prolifera JEL478]|uniref:Uncharacterized protein n=1 Tax=Gonapodya prolifera (strain JEL478) TaxID=1344416 RepID=A0A139ABD3_GONPJ|nr:hypothetical protein M427DRAFT_354931 [Gonapodya prolifera JEL478]|eukprot:KXS14132.1 hypothetical protein M427DRAFT_354931 [Gonapodya prolifera JEL478]